VPLMSRKHPDDRKNTDIPPADFPVLRDFLRGYFHEDLVDEYGSAEAAARQFCEDADAEQRKAVAEEWARLLEPNKSLVARNEVIRTLGAAYQFEKDDEIKQVSEIFREYVRGHNLNSES
jgi:acyl-CoA reductase-like NAD-dependent aldehyde dehydrogenase